MVKLTLKMLSTKHELTSQWATMTTMLDKGEVEASTTYKIGYFFCLGGIIMGFFSCKEYKILRRMQRSLICFSHELLQLKKRKF